MSRCWPILTAILLVSSPLAAQEPSGIEAALAIEKALVRAIAGAEHSVVAIARVRKEQPGESLSLEARPDPFGRRWTAPVVAGPMDPDFVPNEYATGVVVDPRGLILTAYHVLGADSEYYVTTHQRRVYRAQVKGADPRSDLAVLTVDASDLEPIRLGEASELRKGQVVIGLGNPYAIARDGQPSASWGIVANLNRKAPSLPGAQESTGRRTLHQLGTLIQSDVRLGQGTSGGPLLSLQGTMVGLTVALAAAPGAEQAAGYAIPVDATFRRVVEILKEGREVEYGFLGIRPANLKPQEIAEGKQGVRVQSVVRGGPAERRGLRPDDLITAVDGEPTSTADQLMLALGRQPAEAVARLDVIRGRGRLAMDVTLAKYPVQGTKIITAPAPDWRGMRVDYVTAWVDPPAWAASARENFLGSTVVVTEVEEGKPAWEAGLRPGMLISHVDRAAVATPGQFHAVVAGRRGAVQVRLAATPDGQQNVVRTIGPGS